jgi:hypothetical protein
LGAQADAPARDNRRDFRDKHSGRADAYLSRAVCRQASQDVRDQLNRAIAGAIHFPVADDQGATRHVYLRHIPKADDRNDFLVMIQATESSFGLMLPDDRPCMDVSC